MQTENSLYLAMYDVRGIQEYIYRSNRVKDIIGGSEIVDGIVENMLKKALDTLKIRPENIMLDWENSQSFTIENNENIAVELVYSGGGNTLVCFRGKEFCSKVNRLMSRFLIEETYGLNLAVAVIDKGDNYKTDYVQLYKKMSEIKAEMPMTRLLGSLPVTQKELATGFPVYSKSEFGEPLSRETYLKREKFKTLETTANEFDKMVMQKGENSWLAIVHIDGNSMGKRIMELLADETSYAEAVKKMREISKNISDGFIYKALFKTKTTLDNWLKTKDCSLPNGAQSADAIMRTIVKAGDDITFICTASVAFSLCKIFIEEAEKHLMFGDENNPDDMKKYGFSACAGIAFINSHFPFNMGYVAAEEACQSAKKAAKKLARATGENIGSWLDFQLCRSLFSASNFDESRERDYFLPDGSKMIMRPYAVSDENYCGDSKLEKLTDKINLINSGKIPSKWFGELKSSYAEGAHQAEVFYEKMKSRGYEIGEIYIGQETKTAAYFDAIEMAEHYINVEGGANE